MTEPIPPDDASRTRSPRVRMILVGLGLLLAGLMAAVAPDDWPTGPGAVVVETSTGVLLDGPVEIGDDAPVELRGSSGTVAFADGIPTDRTVGATVRVADAVALDDVSVRLKLPDGREELLPVTALDDATRTLDVQRRPTRDAAVVLAVLGLVIVLWISEAFPLFVTSLAIPVVLVGAGVAEAGEATSPFFNPIIVLFFAGFLMARAMQRTRFDHRVAITITTVAGRSPATLFATMLGLTAVLSMWMPNTAATIVLVPIALAVSEPLDEIRFQRALVLGIAYASTIGGVGSAIGTPANQLAIEFLDEYGVRSVSFVQWFAYGLPMVIVFLPVMGISLWRRRALQLDTTRFREARAVALRERRALGRPHADEVVVIMVFAVVALGWLSQSVHGIHPGIVALGGAVLLYALGRLDATDLTRISWPALLTFGGGLTLGLFLVESGTSDWLATRLSGLAGWPTPLAILAVAALTLGLTTVASNTAAAAILIPLAVPLAAVVGVDPTTMVVVVAIASSIDFALVIGTPPTMIAYATRLFTAGQIFRTGIALDFVGIVVLSLVVTEIWAVLGLV